MTAITQRFIPGPRLIDGSDLNTLIDQFNANGGTGTVTSVSVTTANGISGVVATGTTTPAITLTLGAITPSGIVCAGVVTFSAATVNMTSIATADPHIVGRLWANSGVLTISAG